MGIYSEIIVEMALPEVGITDTVFQTKSIRDFFMGKFRLDKEGNFFQEVYHVEDHSDPDATGIERFFGIITPVHEGWEPFLWTGELLFHDRTSSFQAIILKGRLYEPIVKIR